MVKEIVHDTFFLSRRSAPAELPGDIPVADDLLDTLKANAERCVGMAANMIGAAKCIIVYVDNGQLCEMFNPVILKTKDPYETEEGCLSLAGQRKTERFASIKVQWQTRLGQTRIRTFTGWTAQIIQHEIDHLSGKLI